MEASLGILCIAETAFHFNVHDTAGAVAIRALIAFVRWDHEMVSLQLLHRSAGVPWKLCLTRRLHLPVPQQPPLQPQRLGTKMLLARC